MDWTVLHLATEGAVDLDAPVEARIDSWSLPDTPHDTDGLSHRLMTDATAHGHFVDDLDGVQLVLNAGEEEGWVGGFARAPAEGQGIVLLTNSRNGYPLLIEEPRAWSEATGLGTRDRPPRSGDPVSPSTVE